MPLPLVKVTKYLGTGAEGLTPPVIGLPTNLGNITGIIADTSGSGYKVTLGYQGSSSGYFTEYTDKLVCTEANATAFTAWPTGVGCVSFGHAGQPSAVYAPVLGSGLFTFASNGIPSGVLYRGL